MHTDACGKEGRLRFLIVCNDAVGRDLLTVLLKQHDLRRQRCEVEAVSTVAAAEALLARTGFDMVILDTRPVTLEQPDDGGRLALLKRSGSAFRFAAVVENGDLEMRQAMSDAGADVILAWPPEPGSIQRLLALAGTPAVE